MTCSAPPITYNSLVPNDQPSVALQPGFRLGAYEIVSLLGAGGMGEVYRAKDTPLGCDVAITVLPALFAADAERILIRCSGSTLKHQTSGTDVGVGAP